MHLRADTPPKWATSIYTSVTTFISHFTSLYAIEVRLKQPACRPPTRAPSQQPLPLHCSHCILTLVILYTMYSSAQRWFFVFFFFFASLCRFLCTRSVCQYFSFSTINSVLHCKLRTLLCVSVIVCKASSRCWNDSRYVNGYDFTRVVW